MEIVLTILKNIKREHRKPIVQGLGQHTYNNYSHDHYHQWSLALLIFQGIFKSIIILDPQ